MLTIKTLHILCALISITGFIYRGYLKINCPEQLKKKWLKITPHIVDTLLLASAIYLVVAIQQYPTMFNWVSAKIVALLIYIGFGFMTLRFGKNRRLIIVSFVLAILTFSYIVAVALTKQVWPLML